MRRSLNYFGLGIKLILSNALIVAVFVGAWIVYFSLMKGTSIMLNTAFMLFVIVGVIACMLALWIRLGRLYRRRNVALSCLMINLLVAEIEPALIGLLLRQPYRSDDLTYFALSVGVNSLFAIVMPFTVGLSYRLS